MVRIKASVARRQGRKRVFKATKGQFGHRKSRFRQAIRSLIKGMSYAYRDRKVKTREFRTLWIVRINAACRAAGISYSRFMNGLTRVNIEINRKALAEMAVNDPVAFAKIVEIVKGAAPEASSTSAVNA